ncbi:nitroreductase [Burkholderia gladioli]|uniref:Putative NAD(P)H nitroreductase n=1 Tax=Burkholderia gladioli TaxID=28095 RepID=A0AB38U073_BURGA|nr:nitroreductase [Burkholderia gladioli]MBU9640561.1 nitroreductase [Burkholderia gladioli]MBU9682211.1 nitroreductase [Burkholderia gladioli]MCA8166536.1 nitroreductase [Burkholderia gladioli]URV27970.1 nitroreductase [Burkholderia gladioli]UWX73384.1 nitroreductase [Burkholderia gladioli]
MTQASPATLAHAAPAGRALVDILLSRQSHFQLAEPAPRDEEIELIFDAAMRAPDHAQLRPWRFALIRDEARAELAEVLVELAAAREPQLTRDELESRGETARSTPLIIAVAAAIREDGGIPEVEQLLSTGAATMNMLNTIHALGYGAFWITGDDSYDPKLPAALDFEPGDRLLGFLLVGTPVSRDAPPPRPSRADHVREWLGRSSI